MWYGLGAFALMVFLCFLAGLVTCDVFGTPAPLVRLYNRDPVRGAFGFGLTVGLFAVSFLVLFARDIVHWLHGYP